MGRSRNWHDLTLAPLGFWIVTRPAGGGGAKGPPLRSPKLLDRFPNFKRHSSQIFAKNAKNDPKTLFEASKSVKKQNSENHGKVPQMTWKVPVFDMFYAISQPFLKISTWNFVHIFMRHYPLTYVTVFWKFWFGGKLFWKEKKLDLFLNIF